MSSLAHKNIKKNLQLLVSFTAVAKSQPGLDVYEGSNVPRGHWMCYRPAGHQAEKNLDQHVHDLLTPTITKTELLAIIREATRCNPLAISAPEAKAVEQERMACRRTYT